MKRLTSVLAILTILLAYACKSDSSQTNNHKKDIPVVDSTDIAYQYYQRIFLPEEDDIFRKVGFDQTIESVKAAEANGNLTLSEESEDFLQYEEDLFVDTAQGIDYAMLKYIFDSEDRLWIITVNYYIQDSTKTNDLFDLLNEQFTEEYDDYYIDSDGYTVWESEYKRPDSTVVAYDLGIRKLLKFEDPGIQIELMRFGSL